MALRFVDRNDAGTQLSKQLIQYADQSSTIVIGLPRGGVVVAHPVAQALHLPLDMIVTRKIGAPGNPEFAIGAITPDGEGMFNQEVIDLYSISKEHIAAEVGKEQKEAQRRLQLYRAGRSPLSLKEKTVILIDDGIATGYTMLASIAYARSLGAKRVVVAVPVASQDTVRMMRRFTDELIVLYSPQIFSAVGEFYQSFEQTTDQEVISIMQQYLWKT